MPLPRKPEPKDGCECGRPSCRMCIPDQVPRPRR